MGHEIIAIMIFTITHMGGERNIVRDWDLKGD